MLLKGICGVATMYCDINTAEYPAYIITQNILKKITKIRLGIRSGVLSQPDGYKI